VKNHVQEEAPDLTSLVRPVDEERVHRHGLFFRVPGVLIFSDRGVVNEKAKLRWKKDKNKNKYIII
jgi:hypothetical protein